MPIPQSNCLTYLSSSDPPVINDPEDAVVRFAVHDNASLRCSANSKPPSNFTWYEVGNNVALAAGAGTTER